MLPLFLVKEVIPERVKCNTLEGILRESVMMELMVCPHCSQSLIPDNYYLHIYLCDACSQEDEI